MKRLTLLFFFLGSLAASLSAQSDALFDDTQVASIYVDLPADSLAFLIDNVIHDRYFRARFIFDDGQQRDTVEDAGLRLRGNTSLAAEKKSFKISFNEFVPDRKYQGVKKLNLRGQHNDPTMVREKLFYHIWNKAQMADRRSAFVNLYINGEYRGVYTNMEEIDKTWLDRIYGDNEGNLFKCTYPADLVYMGSSQESYKNLLNNPETRAYDLTTNEIADDYSRLVALITALDQPVNAAYADQISQILNVDGVLKAYAIDVATGNWDDYFYNKNNYYLYDNPGTGRFDFITFDTDNTFGIDWVGKDWGKRNALAWHFPGEPRPLASKLMAVPAFKAKFVRYLDTLARLVILPDSIFPHVDMLHDLVAPAAALDPYRTLDYGYTLGDFHNGFDQAIDEHTTYGIKPFLAVRSDSIRSQIAGLLPTTGLAEPPSFSVSVSPNPATDRLWIRTDLRAEEIHGALFETTGRLIATRRWQASPEPLLWPLADLPEGPYVLRLTAGKGEAQFVFWNN